MSVALDSSTLFADLVVGAPPVKPTTVKRCAICRQNLLGRQRVRVPSGKYYCHECYAIARGAACRIHLTPRKRPPRKIELPEEFYHESFGAVSHSSAAYVAPMEEESRVPEKWVVAAIGAVAIVTWGTFLGVEILR